MGSFWEQPLKHTENKELIDKEMSDLLSDLRSLPRNATLRKVNELVKRARMLKVHANILSHLRDQFGWFGKAKKQEELLKGPCVYECVYECVHVRMCVGMCVYVAVCVCASVCQFVSVSCVPVGVCVCVL